MNESTVIALMADALGVRTPGELRDALLAMDGDQFALFRDSVLRCPQLGPKRWRNALRLLGLRERVIVVPADDR